MFVGYSEDTVTGGEGIIGLNLPCAEFGAARVCTTKEFMLSINTDEPAASAWILSEIVGVSGGAPDVQPQCTDFSGDSRDCDQATCNSWAGGLLGLVVTDAGGGIETRQCNLPNPVTCCAPAQ